MDIYRSIEKKLEQALHPSYLEVRNESISHNVPADSQTHFRLTVVAASFEGLSLVQRHRKIYALLQEEFAAGLHALAMHTYVPEEWGENKAVTASPACAKGQIVK